MRIMCYTLHTVPRRILEILRDFYGGEGVDSSGTETVFDWILEICHENKDHLLNGFHEGDKVRVKHPNNLSKYFQDFEGVIVNCRGGSLDIKSDKLGEHNLLNDWVERVDI